MQGLPLQYKDDQSLETRVCPRAAVRERLSANGCPWQVREPLQGIWGRTSSADGFFLCATRFAGSQARSGASCSGQKGGGNSTPVCAGRLVASHLWKTRACKMLRIFISTLNQYLRCVWPQGRCLLVNGRLENAGTDTIVRERVISQGLKIIPTASCSLVTNRL